MSYGPKRPGATKAEKVVIGLSGGVASAASAILLKEQGYDLVALCLKVPSMGFSDSDKRGSLPSCYQGNLEGAAAVADKLKIPFFAVDVEDLFRERVVENIMCDLLQGRATNSCLQCNRHVKFEVLWKKALDMDATALATGHFVSVTREPKLGWCLWRPKDEAMDQSFFLSRLEQRHLEHSIFPMGDLTYVEAKKLVRDHKIPVIERTSQALKRGMMCFEQGDLWEKHLEERVAGYFRRPGYVVDIAGNVLGEHKGIYHFRMGTRQNVAECLDPALTQLAQGIERMVVVKIDPNKARVVIAPLEDAEFWGMAVVNTRWVVAPDLRKPRFMEARLAPDRPPVMCKVNPLGDQRLQVRFTEGQGDVRRGAPIVFYDGRLCLGSGWIEDYLKVKPDERPQVGIRGIPFLKAD